MDTIDYVHPMGCLIPKSEKELQAAKLKEAIALAARLAGASNEDVAAIVAEVMSKVGND